MGKNTSTTPEPFSALIDHITGNDQRRFEEEPELRWFVRGYIYGEFWPDRGAGVERVQVIQIEPGVRVRVPLPRGADPLDPNNPPADELGRLFRRAIDATKRGLKEARRRG